MTVTPASTVQHCIPRSLTPEITPEDVSLEEKDDEGRMNLESTELESPSAGTGLETTGQQCPPNGETGETGRTIADGYLLVSMGSNQGENNPPTERVGTRAGRTTTTSAASKITFLQQGHKTRDKTPSEENKQFDPDGKGEKPPLWNAAVMVLFFFLGGALSHGRLAACTSCSLFVRASLSVHYLLFCQVITFQPAEKHERRRGSSR